MCVCIGEELYIVGNVIVTDTLSAHRIITHDTPGALHR